MHTELNIVKEDELSVEERGKIDKQIDQLIERHKNNRYEINKLVFESVTSLTESNNYSAELASQGIVKKLWGGITGKNRKMQDKIDRGLAASQYASQQTLQKLSEQNLMSFELITAVNNKLNASIVQVENEINKVYGTLVAFFKQTKSDIIKLENRVERLERNVNLLNWQNSIEYQMWNGVEYSELDDVSKLVCLTRDFYDITKANWTTSDLLLLKTAMTTIGISPKDKITYKQFISGVSNTPKLMTKLFDGIQLENAEKYPEYVAITAGIQKSHLLEADEKYLVDNIVEVMRKYSYDVSEVEVKDDMMCIYERNGAHIDMDFSVDTYDLMLEMLYNLKEVKEIQYVATLDDKLKEAEMLFSVYDTKKLIPLLQELISYGVTKAKYMMGLLYETGCENVKRDDDKFIELMDECISEEYCPAVVRKCIPLWLPSEEKELCMNYIYPIQSELERMAASGDKFAAEECARVYINTEFLEMDCSAEEGYVKAIKYYRQAPLVLRNYALAKTYDKGRGVEKNYEMALSYYLKAANMEYNLAEFMVGQDYEYGCGTEKNPRLAFEYYKRAYEHGERDAINKCGWCLTNNFGTENDYDLAYKYFKEGEELGDPVCIANVGWCYQFGKGVEKDVTKAKEYYQQAADMGNEWAKGQLDNLLNQT